MCFKMCLIIFSLCQQTSEFIWMKEKCVVCKQCTSQGSQYEHSCKNRFFHINAVDLYFFLSYLYRLGANNWFLFSYHSDSSANNPWFLLFITELISWLEKIMQFFFNFFLNSKMLLSKRISGEISDWWRQFLQVYNQK